MKALSTLFLIALTTLSFSPQASAFEDIQARPGRGGDDGFGRGDGGGRGGDWRRPGRGPGRPGRPGPGRPGPGRPGPGHPGPGYPGPAPRPVADLCQGTYVGGYSNGASAVISIQRQWGEQINVQIQLNGREFYTAQGTCQQWGNQAQFVFTLHGHGIVHRGNINEDWNGQATMQGAQDGGFAFQARR